MLIRARFSVNAQNSVLRQTYCKCYYLRMEQEFFEVDTTYTQTASGLILPHQTGKAVLALGRQVPKEHLESFADQMDLKFEPGQGGIYLSTAFFVASALKVAAEQGWRPPTS